MLRIENAAQSDKLPIEHPLPEIINIYTKRLGIFFAIVAANFLILGFLLGAKYFPRISPFPLYAFFITVVLMLFIGIPITAYSMAYRTNKITGRLIFMDGNIPIVEFGLHQKVISGKQLRHYPQLGIKKIRVSKSATEPNAIRIQIAYYNGNKADLTLLPNLPFDVLGSNFIIIYEMPN